MRKIKKIIIHCSATKHYIDIGAKEIRQWHLSRGFRDIGYHYVIRLDGRLEDGRRIEEVGAHCIGQNKHSIGICMVGGLDDYMRPRNTFTKEQFASLEALIKDLKTMFPKATIHPHNEFVNKACPCFNVKDWLSSLQNKKKKPIIKQKKECIFLSWIKKIIGA